MLTELRIGNFKAFGKTQKIPIKPLTLIFGPNSSGKSSILHALLLLHEANRTGSIDVTTTQLGGEAIDLGGFDEFIHKKDPSLPLEIGLTAIEPEPPDADPASEGGDDEAFNRRMDWVAEQDTYRHLFDWRFVRGSVGSGERASTPRSVRRALREFRQGRCLLPEMAEAIDVRLSGVSSGYLMPCPARDSLVWDDAVRETAKGLKPSVSKADFRRRLSRNPGGEEITEETLLALFRDAQGRVAPPLPDRPTLRAWFQGILEGKLFSLRAAPRLRSLIPSLGDLDPLHSEDLTAVARLLAATTEKRLSQASETLASLLELLVYLGPSRWYPPRYPLLPGAEPGIGEKDGSGGFAWARLLVDSSLREKVNLWLSSTGRLKTRYEFSVASLLSSERSAAIVSDRLAKLMEAAKNRSIPHQRVAEVIPEIESLLSQEGQARLRLRDTVNRTFVSTRDVGFGISQLLPILVTCLGESKKLIAVEQPELHLHPALQADLGDVFIESAMGEPANRIILETHSEHLILRVLRRIRETNAGRLPEGLTPIRPEDVAVLYVSPSPEGSIVEEIPVTPDGDFASEWPGGFFEERGEELFS